MFESMFEENKKAPEETIIMSSRVPAYKTILSYCVIAGFLVWWAFKVPTFTTTLVLCAIGLLFIVLTGHEIRGAMKKQTISLRLDNKGLYQANGDCIPWEQVDRFEFVEKNFYDNSMACNLILYNKHGMTTTIDFEDLDISSQKLNYLMKIYKDRSIRAI